MVFLRVLLFPVVPIYYAATWLRNWLYNTNLLKSKSYNFPVICVGNLNTGGTGKTPMIEYLIRLLKDKKRLATLSRGYKRNTKGFVLADKSASAKTIGDEPYQFFKKFGDYILVAVDNNRLNGIEKLKQHLLQPEVVLLDDAYQHRKVKAGFNILLTAYDDLFVNDMVLPTGNLRESKSSAQRADVIVVTKCPAPLLSLEKERITAQLRPKKNQTVFFSGIAYSESVFSASNNMVLKDLPHFTLITGIANTTPLTDFLKLKRLEFEHLEFPDHYNFKSSDIKHFEKKGLLLTTEKDYMRLSVHNCLSETLYYLPIETKLFDQERFDSLIEHYSSSF